MKTKLVLSTRGFTLIEVLVAISIFAIVSSSVSLGMINFLRYNTRAELRTHAAAVAQETLEELRNIDPTTLPSSGTTSEEVAYASRTFTVDTTYCASASLCASPRNRQITVQVTYKGEPQYEIETVFTQLQ